MDGKKIAPTEGKAPSRREQAWCLCQTPIGTVHITESEKGITGLSFCGDTEQAPDISGIYLGEACRQLREYFSKKRRSFDVPLDLRGSEFQRRVWNELQCIPYGETLCYQDIAERIGSPKAARAVGLANNRNPILIMIPCHRVVGKNKKLIGYAGGIERKEYLLALEND